MSKFMLQINRIIGHRGAAAYAPENTIVSFQKAKQLGCTFIEFDVVQNKGGELFIFHDEELQRTSNGKGKFYVQDSSYIKSLDVGGWFSRKYAGTTIPTFKDAIAWFAQNDDMRANIEIKLIGGKALEITKAVLSEIELYWPPSHKLPLVSSFDYEVLLMCHKLNSELPLGLLLDCWPTNWHEMVQSINCHILNLNKKIATESIIAEINNRGVQANIFTVNSRRQALKFFEWGVNAVFSDYPDLLTNLKP